MGDSQANTAAGSSHYGHAAFQGNLHTGTLELPRARERCHSHFGYWFLTRTERNRCAHS